MKNEVILGLLDCHIAVEDAENKLSQYIVANDMALPKSKTAHVIYRGYLWEVKFKPDGITCNRLNEAKQVSIVTPDGTLSVDVPEK